MKSEKVLALCSMRPSSYQARPISPPPRTCAMAKTHAAVEEREAVVGEGRVDRDLVGAVAVEDARGRQRQALAVHERDRDTRPVRRDRPLPVRLVAVRVEVAQDGLLLEQRLGAAVERDLQDARRGHHGRAPDPQDAACRARGWRPATSWTGLAGEGTTQPAPSRSVAERPGRSGPGPQRAGPGPSSRPRRARSARARWRTRRRPRRARPDGAGPPRATRRRPPSRAGRRARRGRGSRGPRRW